MCTSWAKNLELMSPESVHMIKHMSGREQDYEIKHTHVHTHHYFNTICSNLYGSLYKQPLLFHYILKLYSYSISRAFDSTLKLLVCLPFLTLGKPVHALFVPTISHTKINSKATAANIMQVNYRCSSWQKGTSQSSRIQAGSM